MKDDEINIAIAETIFPAVIGGVACEIVEDRWGDAEPVPIGPVPNYCGDLNAMHCAEKSLQNQFNMLEESYWRALSHVKPHPIYAIARQRAEAYLRTLNLWRE